MSNTPELESTLPCSDEPGQESTPRQMLARAEALIDIGRNGDAVPWLQRVIGPSRITRTRTACWRWPCYGLATTPRRSRLPSRPC
jgi:hypothetical protein